MTNLAQRRKTADAAAASVALRRQQLTHRTVAVTKVIRQWSPALLVGGGLLGGLLLGSRRTAQLASGVFSLASLGLALLRSPLAPVALSAALRRQARPRQESSMETEASVERDAAS